MTNAAPKMVDDGTRLDGATAGPGLILTYLYTLPKVASTDIAPGAFADRVPDPIKKAACSSAEMRPFFDNNVTVHYVYRGSDGGQIGTVTVTREICAAR